MAVKLAWAEKYRPDTLKNFVFQDDTHKAKFEQFVREKSFPNLLFSGGSGTGKTSLARLLKSEVGIDDVDFHVFNASTDNSVELIRTKITNIISSYPMGEFKLIFFDEADGLSVNAQNALRALMETNTETVRFILTCNHPHKITTALKSRVQEFKFESLPRDALLDTAARILTAEKVKVKDLDILDHIVDKSYPDCRKMIMLLEQGSIGGVLTEPEESSLSVETQFQIMSLMETDKWQEVREYAASHVSDDEWEGVYRFIYDYLHESGKFTDKAKWSKGILFIADHLWRHSMVSDPEINFAALTIKLSEI